MHLNLKISLLVLILGIFVILIPGFSFAQDDLQLKNSVCTVYFTYVGCPNCAYTDPIVLTEWTKKYSNLVVIEYMWYGGDWKSPNSQFFGKFCQKYKIQAAVPQLVIDKNNIKLGAIDVPAAEKDIRAKEFNPCLLLDKSISFAELNLKELPGKPKIWANERILISLGNDNWLFQWDGEGISEEIAGEKSGDNKLLKDLLFVDNVSKILDGVKFEIAESQRVEFSGIAFPGSGFLPYINFENAIKISFFEAQPDTGPTEPEEEEGEEEEEEREEGVVEIPFIGKIKTKGLSLPVLTLLLAGADGFNPCAFFVLTFLLAALLGLAGVRKKILLVGGIFILFSGLFYFLFMAVLFNVFLLGKEIMILTIIAGLIAIFAGLINIKDYFFFQKGISLTLPRGRKLKFFERVAMLSKARSTLALVIGAAIIAGTVNIYELLCTFGFPMIYTRILTLRDLPSLQYYLYLIFYNLIYVIPLTVIVLIFAATLGKRKFGQDWVRRLKLISGFMILFLGLVLVFQPKLLENIFTAFSVLILAIVVSGVIIFIKYLCKKFKCQK